jgi:uncharacterized protein (TIGR01619 family)
MSEDWDFYFLKVNDELSSIFVDLGVVNKAPLIELPFLATLRIRMRDPRADGLSSGEEFESLIAIENAILRTLERDSKTIYVGRRRSSGFREFYFYTNERESWRTMATEFMDSFPEYPFDCDVREEQNWNTYLEFLFPGAEDLQRIRNRQVCQALKKQGDDLSMARSIDHWAYFPDGATRSGFTNRIHGLGFERSDCYESEDSDPSYGVEFSRVDTPGFDGMDGVTLNLRRLAKEFGGTYDGWGTSTTT